MHNTERDDIGNNSNSHIINESIVLILEYHKNSLYNNIMNFSQKDKKFKQQLDTTIKKNSTLFLDSMNSYSGSSEINKLVINIMIKNIDIFPLYIQESCKTAQYIDNILQYSTFTMYGLNFSAINYHVNSIKKHKGGNSSIEIEDCMEIFMKMSPDHIKKLSQDISQETIFSIVYNYLYKYLYNHIKEIYTSEIGMKLLMLLKEEITHNIYYNSIKKTKYYIGSVNSLKKLIDKFIVDEDGLKDILSTILYEKKEKIPPNEPEFFIALTPFLLEEILESNPLHIIYNYLLVCWNREIENEYKDLQIRSLNKNNSNLNHIQNQKIITSDKVITSEKKLSEQQSLFISDIQKLFGSQEKQKIIGQYLSRMLKNNNVIRIFDRLKSQNIVITDLLLVKIKNTFIQYNYIDQSVSIQNNDDGTINNIDCVEEEIVNSSDTFTENNNKNIVTNWNSFIENIGKQSLFLEDKNSLKILYNSLQPIDRKSLHDKLELAIHHPNIYRETRPNKCKVLKFGLRGGWRLMVKENTILGIESRSASYSRVMTQIYNAK